MIKLKLATLSFAFVAALAFGSGTAQAEKIKLTATLDGATEVPSVTTDAKGTAKFTLNTVTKKLYYNVTYTGLSGPATGAHIHGPADHGANAGVVKPLHSTASPLKGNVTLNDAEISDLLAGKDYVNIHTAANPNGEIRGYISK